MRRLCQESVNWPTVEGQVISTEVDASSSRYGTSYYPSIDYWYTVAKKDYLASWVYMGSYEHSFKSGEAAKAVLSDYERRPDQRVTVFYNPNNPAEAVLEPGVTKGIQARIRGGFKLILLGVLMFFVFWVKAT